MEAARAITSALTQITQISVEATKGAFRDVSEDTKRLTEALSKRELITPKVQSLSPSFIQFSPMGTFSILKPYYTSAMFRLGKDPRLPQPQRKKVVVIGSGWASITFIKNIDVTKYDVSVISPSTHFSFTPLLPSVCAGALTKRACAEPIRNHLSRGGKNVMSFYQATASEVNPKKKSLTCKDQMGRSFELPYDYLVVGVGSGINTFGIPGVAEHTHFLKDASQAESIHNKILECFEKAASPSATEEDKKKFLSFVIVGGGPSGVEVAAEVADFIKNDVPRHYPQLEPHARVTLIEMLPKVLPMFAPSASEYALQTLREQGCSIQLKCRVSKVTPNCVFFVDESGKEHQLPCGFALWASGIGQTPFAKHLMTSSETQKNSRILKVDETLRVQGLEDCYAFGDCAAFTPKPLADISEELYEQAKKRGKVTSKWLLANKKKISTNYPQIRTYNLDRLPNKSEALSKEQFTEILKDIDTTYVRPPTTAQVAAQEAAYLAQSFNVNLPKNKEARAWIYNWKGQMSYVGGGNSIIQTPYGIKHGGFMSHTLWKLAYLMRLMSFSSQMTAVTDWIRIRAAGREIGK